MSGQIEWQKRGPHLGQTMLIGHHESVTTPRGREEPWPGFSLSEPERVTARPPPRGHTAPGTGRGLNEQAWCSSRG